MRKIILNLAMSLDGYIVDENYSYDWITGDGDHSLDTLNQFDFKGFLDSIDTVVMGRKSYDDIGVEDYKNKQVIVATSRPLNNYNQVKFVSTGIVEYVLELRKAQGKDIWIFGGAGLADYFLKADVINEFIIGIVPLILGNGTKLFNDKIPTVPLHLEEYTVQEGLVIMRYTRR